MVNALCAELAAKLSRNEAVSVRNFGTLSPYLYHGHFALDVSSGLMHDTAPFKTVQFRVHARFLRLLKERRTRFLR